MKLPAKRLLVAAAALAAVGAGVGGAIAASGGPDREAEKQAFLADAAGRLGVTPQRLEDALQEAAKARVDAAVKAGRLTEEQGARLKQAIDEGRLGHGLGPGRSGHHRGPGPLRSGLQAAADYLGVTPLQLVQELRGGKSLAEVAKAKGKSVDGLKAAIRADVKSRLDQAVKDGRLTAARASELLERLDERLDELVNRSRPEGMRPFRGHGMHGGFGHHG